jgi:hypothetical protein
MAMPGRNTCVDGKKIAKPSIRLYFSKGSSTASDKDGLLI